MKTTIRNLFASTVMCIHDSRCGVECHYVNYKIIFEFIFYLNLLWSLYYCRIVQNIVSSEICMLHLRKIWIILLQKWEINNVKTDVITFVIIALSRFLLFITLNKLLLVGSGLSVIHCTALISKYLVNECSGCQWQCVKFASIG